MQWRRCCSRVGIPETRYFLHWLKTEETLRFDPAQKAESYLPDLLTEAGCDSHFYMWGAYMHATVPATIVTQGRNPRDGESSTISNKEKTGNWSLRQNSHELFVILLLSSLSPVTSQKKQKQKKEQIFYILVIITVSWRSFF